MPEVARSIRGLLDLGLVEFYRDLELPGQNYIALTDAELGDHPGIRSLLERPEADRGAGLMLTKAGRLSSRLT